MDDLKFYKDCFINRELAFVLEIPYVFIEDSQDLLDTDQVFVLEEYQEEFIEQFGDREYLILDDICDYLDQYNRENSVGGREAFERDFDAIEQIPLENLSLSEMLIKVLYSEAKDIDCHSIEENAFLDYKGELWGCCPYWLGKTFGNILKEENLYDNYYARILKLSSMNKTYCFCRLHYCKYYGSPTLSQRDENIVLESLDVPKQLTIASDWRCNLRCNSCRKCFYVPSEEEKELSHNITEKLLEKDWLSRSYVYLAGQGEVFFCPEYLRILKSDQLCGDTIKILSNGTLFTKDKWRILEHKFKNIHVEISIDAATKETYQKLRHGNFDALVKNLKMLGDLRKKGKIYYYQLNFVVQKDNYLEMKDFINLAKSLSADIVYFTKLNNWGTFSDEEYRSASMISDDILDYDLYEWLQDEVFQDKMVSIELFNHFMENSKRYYENNNFD